VIHLDFVACRIIGLIVFVEVGFRDGLFDDRLDAMGDSRREEDREEEELGVGVALEEGVTDGMIRGEDVGDRDIDDTGVREGDANVVSVALTLAVSDMLGVGELEIVLETEAVLEVVGVIVSDLVMVGEAVVVRVGVGVSEDVAERVTDGVKERVIVAVGLEVRVTEGVGEGERDMDLVGLILRDAVKDRDGVAVIEGVTDVDGEELKDLVGVALGLDVKETLGV